VVPVSMICPAKVSRPAMAVQSRGAVKVLVRPEAGWLAAMATPPGGAVRSGWPFVPMEPDA